MAEALFPPWLLEHPGREVDAPLRNAKGFRAATVLRHVLEQFQVESAPRYRVRDFDGDGKAETWCNRFVSDATRALGCPVPYLLANKQVAWLESDGAKLGWFEVPEPAARGLVQLGWPVVAARRKMLGHGHVAMGKPLSPDTPEALRAQLCITQAGRICRDGIPLVAGFGGEVAAIRFWAHE